MKFRLVPSLIALLASAPLLAAGDAISFSAQQQQVLGVKVAPLTKASAVSGAALPAQVSVPPSQLRVVASPLDGMVELLLVAEGDHVRAGDVLARLQSPQLLGLQREMLQALSQQRLALSEWQRDEELFSEGVIAKRRYLETQSRYQEQSAALEERRQALRLAGMDGRDITQLEKSRQLTTVLNIRSPLTGVVLERLTDTGRRLALAEPIYRLADPSTLWLEIRTPIETARQLSDGSEVQVSGQPAKGQVIGIGHDVDATSQTVLVRARVTEGAKLLWPGQYLQASLATAATTPLYELPSAAVVRSGNKSVIFVQQASGFQAVSIQLITSQGGVAIIAGPLRGDEQVAVSGIAAIKGAWLGLGGGE